MKVSHDQADEEKTEHESESCSEEDNNNIDLDHDISDRNAFVNQQCAVLS